MKTLQETELVATLPGACRICGSFVLPFLNFGTMPIANGFLSPEEFGGELLFELEAGFCEACGMVQLTKHVSPDKLFHSEYPYFTSISQRMTLHFERFGAELMRSRLPNRNAFVMEIGSNDGTLLKAFVRGGVRHLGVEPAANVAQLAIRQGVQTWIEFFDEDIARKIRTSFGQADVILGANVICHIPNLSSVFAGVRLLLKETGVFVFEEPYLQEIVRNTAYDQIYDEHIYYFSATSLQNALNRHDLEILDLIPQEVHGGSMRYVVGVAGLNSPAPIVAATIEQERAFGLSSLHCYEEFRGRVEALRDGLRGLIAELKRRGNRLVGYGATSKSTTLLNYCGIGPEQLDYIVDTSPGKRGKYSPGVHIPIVPPQEFSRNYPDYALLLAWNHRAEILGKELAFRDAGGRFITYVPYLFVT